MKTHKISNINNYNIQKKNNLSFKGFVNRNYYKDEIIERAKKYRFDRRWKQKLRKDKKTLIEAIKTWHEDLPGTDTPLAARILTAVTSFGVSEILMATMVTIATTYENFSIENEINEIAKCIDDINNDKDINKE